MTAFRAAFKAYRMHQVLIMPRFARLTIALGLATAVFPVDAEYYFNPRFLSNDLAESVDLSAFTKGREAPPGTYRVDIYLNDEFMKRQTAVFRHYMFLIRLFRFSNVLDIRVMRLPWGNIVVEITCKALPSSYKVA